jgi:hypothetical protein
MWPYWLMFIPPALAALANSRLSSDQIGGSLRFNLKRGWWLVSVLTLLIGFRYQVGGDWGNYIRNLQSLARRSLTETLTASDPGYRLLEFLSVYNDWGIYGVNLIGAAFFSFGLVVFCCNLPRPWLALTVAMPYMVTVVAMGYTRQGIAIGLAMLGLVALGRHSVRKFVFWVLLGFTFHKSAILLLPIAALAATRKRLWTAVWVAVIVAGAYSQFLAESVDVLYQNYVEDEYQSQGALIRLSMNAVPAVILLRWRRNFEMSLAQMRLWTWFALISLALLAAYFVTPASTALDRIALYMLPLQLAVFAYVPEVFGGRRTRNQLFVAAVVGYYALVLFVWLNFATHARYWVPYKNWLFL